MVSHLADASVIVNGSVIVNERGRGTLLRTYVLKSGLYYGDALKASLKGLKCQSFIDMD